MAEGHTIHALARRFAAAFLGSRPVASSPTGALTELAASIDRREVTSVEAYGKNLLVDVDGPVLHVHLGMFGVFHVIRHRRKRRLGDAPDLPVKGAVRLRLVNTTHVGDLHAPMVCELLDAAGAAALMARLGPDPLRADADPTPFLDAVAASDRTIAELLMDQSVLAGVGNVYRSELLFRARLDPYTPGRLLSRDRIEGLWDDLAAIMPWGVESGRILTTASDLDRAAASLADAGTVPRLRPTYAVYLRAGRPCPECGAPIQSRKLAGRTLYWCPRCQA